MIWVIFLAILSSCTMFSKSTGNDEMEKMSELVIKKGEGLSIKIEPIEETKK
jgi:hypothetical protein